MKNTYTAKQLELIKELKPVDQEELFNEYLDECSPMIKIGALEYYPSKVLSEVDPTAYRCEVNDYIDSLIGEALTEEIDGEYYRLEDVEDILNQEES